MRGEVVDSLAQQRDLHFGRTGVFGVNPVLLDYTGLGFHQLILPLKRRAPALCSSPLQLENASTEPVARKGNLPLPPAASCAISRFGPATGTRPASVCSPGTRRAS